MSDPSINYVTAPSLIKESITTYHSFTQSPIIINFRTTITSSILLLRTPTAKTTSQRSFLSMDLGESSYFIIIIFTTTTTIIIIIIIITIIITIIIFTIIIICFSHEVLPIAMGARPEDYERQAPYKSYIHVDQFAGFMMMLIYILLLKELYVCLQKTSYGQ